MGNSQPWGLRRPLRTEEMLSQTHKARHAKLNQQYNPKPIRLAQIKNLISPAGTYGKQCLPLGPSLLWRAVFSDCECPSQAWCLNTRAGAVWGLCGTSRTWSQAADWATGGRHWGQQWGLASTSVSASSCAKDVTSHRFTHLLPQEDLPYLPWCGELKSHCNCDPQGKPSLCWALGHSSNKNTEFGNFQLSWRCTCSWSL